MSTDQIYFPKRFPRCEGVRTEYSFLGLICFSGKRIKWAFTLERLQDSDGSNLLLVCRMVSEGKQFGLPLMFPDYSWIGLQSVPLFQEVVVSEFLSDSCVPMLNEVQPPIHYRQNVPLLKRTPGQLFGKFAVFFFIWKKKNNRWKWLNYQLPLLLASWVDNKWQQA